MKHRYFICLFIIVCLCLSACSPKSESQFTKERCKLLKQLIKEMRSIHSEQDFDKMAPKLRNSFNKFVMHIESYGNFHEKHPSISRDVQNIEVKNLAEELKQEMKRIYSMNNGRKYIEKAQQQAFFRLDEHELSITMKKEDRF